MLCRCKAQHALGNCEPNFHSPRNSVALFSFGPFACPRVCPFRPLRIPPLSCLISHLMRSHADDDDPLAAALRPPPDESPEARAIRIAREEEARRVSQAIDESIRTERQTNKKFRIVRVLLLGQSESGVY